MSELKTFIVENFFIIVVAFFVNTIINILIYLQKDEISAIQKKRFDIIEFKIKNTQSYFDDELTRVMISCLEESRQEYTNIEKHLLGNFVGLEKNFINFEKDNIVNLENIKSSIELLNKKMIEFELQNSEQLVSMSYNHFALKNRIDNIYSQINSVKEDINTMKEMLLKKISDLSKSEKIDSPIEELGGPVIMKPSLLNNMDNNIFRQDSIYS